MKSMPGYTYLVIDISKDKFAVQMKLNHSFNDCLTTMLFLLQNVSFAVDVINMMMCPDYYFLVHISCCSLEDKSLLSF